MSSPQTTPPRRLPALARVELALVELAAHRPVLLFDAQPTPSTHLVAIAGVEALRTLQCAPITGVQLVLACDSDLDPAGALEGLEVVRGGVAGVLETAGVDEAALDLSRLSQRGTAKEATAEGALLARVKMSADEPLPSELESVPSLSVADLVRYRHLTEHSIDRVAEAPVPTEHGTFRAVVYEAAADGQEHVAFVMGSVDSGDVLVRLHSECLTGDIFGSLRCDCGPQLDQALARIADEGRGVVVYLRGHEGRGIGLARKIEAYRLQDLGLDTVDANLKQGLPADARSYGAGALILKDLGVSRVRLMTNNPEKLAGIDGYGLELITMIGHETEPTAQNLTYLRTKKDRMGHVLGIADPDSSAPGKEADTDGE